MSRLGKILLGLGALFFAGSGIFRIVTQVWNDSLYLSLGLGLLLVIAGIAKDFRVYKDFLTLKTTKGGLAMGWVIVIAIFAVGLLNYIAVKHDKTWDLTSEKINSLADQSAKVVKDLPGELKIVLLFRKEQQEDNTRRAVEELARLYSDVNKNVKFEAYGALSRPDIAQKYEFKTGEAAIYAEYNGKHLKVEAPTEESLTRTILKLTRKDRKVIYFTQGHGERGLDGPEPDRLTQFKQELESSYDVKPLTLFGLAKIPDDAAVVGIIGPANPLLPAEVATLREYARRGGQILVAADPFEKHEIGEFTKLFGIDFRNEMVADPSVQVQGAGNVLALGVDYSSTSEITRTLNRSLPSLIYMGSALQKKADAPSGFRIENLVSTAAISVGIDKLVQQAKPSSKGPHTLVMSSTGKLPTAAGEQGEATKDFMVTVFGDSDVFSNQMYTKYANKDLVGNTIAAMAKDTDLISIRPKTLKGTVVDFKSNKKFGLVFGVMLPVPLIMLMISIVVFFRRRTA